MLTRICNKAGCNALIPITAAYCEAHTGEVTQRHKAYDATRRDARSTAFYKSSPWLHMREYIIHKYKNLDIYAYYVQGVLLPATTIHHVVEISECWERRLDASNLFPISDGNHNVIHQLYKKDKAGTTQALFNMLERFRNEYQISL